MSLYTDKAQASLQQREELKQKILKIVFERCDDNEDGRVQPGAVQLYVWHTMGFRGHVDKDFAAFVKTALWQQGYTVNSDSGHKYIKNLKWKGEKLEDWRAPKAIDIPHWIDKKRKFRYVLEDGSMVLNKPPGPYPAIVEIVEPKPQNRYKKIYIAQDDNSFITEKVLIT